MANIKTGSNSGCSAFLLKIFIFGTLIQETRLGMPKLSIGNPQEDCLSSPIYPDDYINSQNLQLFSSNPQEILNLKTLPNPLTHGVGFGNTAMHKHIANHNYMAAQAILKIYQSNPALTEKILQEVDINGRTPLLLAMEVAAPANFVLKLITEDNVIIADKNEVTPLMLSFRGMDPSIFNEIVKKIGLNLFEELNKKNNKNHDVETYSNLKPEELVAMFKAVGVEPSKSANHCRDQLFARTSLTLETSVNIGVQKIQDRFREIFIQSHIGLIHPNNYVFETATAQNCERIIEITTSKNKLDSKFREFVNDKAKNPLQSDFRAKEAKRLLGSGLAKESLLQRYAKNQEVYRNWLEDVRKAKSSINNAKN